MKQTDTSGRIHHIYTQKTLFDFTGEGLGNRAADSTNTPTPEQDFFFNLWMSGEIAQLRIRADENPGAYQVIDLLNWNLFHAWEGTRTAGAQA